MIIIYSPYYDQDTYTAQNAGEVRFDEITLGTHGLLSELELRAGMTHKEMSRFDRIIAYYLAIKEVLKDGFHPFYEESFLKDEINVTEELLTWRDALVMTGWTSTAVDDMPAAYKFRALADIEAYFNCPGEADRWQELRNAKGELAGHTVDVRVPKSSIDKVIADVLDASGAKINYPDEFKGEELKLEAEINVIEMRNRVDAYRWASGQTFPEGTLVVNQDNKALDDVLRAMGAPLVKSEYTDSNPLTLQLFKLGFGLFSKVVDIKTLVSFLNIPVNPLPFKSRMALLDQLTDKGGYGEDWAVLLEKNDIDLNPLNVAQNPPNKVSVKEISIFSDWIKSWALKKSHELAGTKKDLNLADQLSALLEMCKALDTVLATVSGEMEYDALQRWVGGIYSACSFTADKAQIGSMTVINDLKAIVKGPDHLIWLDCNADGHSKYPLSFLSPVEIEFLESFGLTVVSDEVFTKTASIAAKKALGAVRKSITLVMARKAYGQRVDEHPIYTEIKAKKIAFKNIVEPAMPAGEQLEVKTLPSPPYEFALEKGKTVLARPKGESFSSLDTLIQRPVDYVLDYIVGLKEKDMAQLADLSTAKGNVAHKVIEKLSDIAKASGRLSFTDNELDDIIDGQAAAWGVLLANSKVQFDSYKVKLRQSVKTLFGAISAHGLKVFDCEHYIEVELPDDGKGQTIGKFNARIDLLLQNERKDFVIIDLKWSESGRYKEKIAEQKDLQLILYSKALKAAYPKHNVLGCGYYVIPQYTVETRSAYFEDWSIANCNIPDETCDVYGEATRSFFFRKDQLERKVLEGAEGLVFSSMDMEYVKAIEDGIDLYPLDHMYGDEESKATAYGDKNYILKERAL